MDLGYNKNECRCSECATKLAEFTIHELDVDKQKAIRGYYTKPILFNAQVNYILFLIWGIVVGLIIGLVL